MTAPAKNVSGQGQAPKTAPVKKSNRALRNNLTAYSFIAPNFIGFCVFTMVNLLF